MIGDIGHARPHLLGDLAPEPSNVGEAMIHHLARYGGWRTRAAHHLPPLDYYVPSIILGYERKVYAGLRTTPPPACNNVRTRFATTPRHSARTTGGDFLMSQRSHVSHCPLFRAASKTPSVCLHLRRRSQARRWRSTGRSGIYLPMTPPGDANQ